MLQQLLQFKRVFLLLSVLVVSVAGAQQATVYSTDFSTASGTSYTVLNGQIGTSPWSMLRSGQDLGARISGGLMTLTNDASGASNVSGWVMAYSTSGLAAPYSSTLSANPGVVTWTFNMRQIRSNPSGMASGYYGNAFILAGSSNTTATTGSGYAVVLGQNGKIDPIRLVRYTTGLRTSTNIITSNTSGLADFGNQYLSVKVTYTPSTNTWQLFVRNDGTGAFQDPATGTLTSQGTAVNNGSTTTALPLLGMFWNANSKGGRTAYFDNVSVTVGIPAITSISPSSRIAGSGAFTLTANGANFINGSTIQWNGTNLTTTYVSATQLTASVPATLIASAGSASITVATGSAVSNSQTLIIDPAGVPSIAVSATMLPNFTTITGTASSAQSFTSTGTNLTGNITVTAPANFELTTGSAGNTYSSTLSLPATTTTIFARVKSSAAAGLYSGSITLSTPGGITKQVSVTARVLSLQPATPSTALTFSNVTSISFTANLTAGNGAQRIAIVRSGSAVNAAPVNGETYTAGSFGSGSEIGSGNYVAYKGTSNSFTITGLSPATTYYVAVYEVNGSAGTENYGSSALTGNRLTLNAPVGLQVAALNTRYTIDFDTTVEGVNNDTYNGGSFNTAPEQGELNSNAWAVTGMPDGAVAFGGASPDESDYYENGTADGGVIDGGLYAFEVAPNNYALGFQAVAGTFSPGTITLRFQNQTSSAVTSLNIGYKVYVYNDEAGANSFNFSHSANNTTYTAATVLNQSTTATADALPGWKMYYKVVTLTGLNIAANSYYYIRWTGDAVSGTAYDEIALDDITIVANPSTSFVTVAGTAETAVLAGNTSLSGATTVNSDITFNGGKMYIGNNTLTVKGTITNTTAGGLSGGNTSNVAVSGSVNPTLSFDQATVGTTNVLNNLSINTAAANTVTLGNNLVLNGILTVDENQTLALAGNTLTGTLATITNNGTVTTTNTTTTPFASGKTWGGTGTLVLGAATAAQYLPAGTYNKVTVSTTGGGNAAGDVTLTGDLNLPNANVSATKGAFDTGAFTVTMAATAANTGIGDVSGITARTSGITTSTRYTLGHPRTSIIFPLSGTLPTSMAIKLILGQAPAGKTDGILRTYDFIQTGGTGTKALISAHYLDSELNGNIENRLVDWVVNVSPLTLIEQSRTSYSTTENYVELGNVNVAFFASTYGSKLLTLANSQVTAATWNGSVSTSWTTAANWTPNATPSDNTKVIIPDAGTTPNDPILNPSVTIGALSIEAGGILNSPSGSQFTITGSTGAWINYGTFNPADGTVTFNAASSGGDVTMAGNTTFNNLTIPSGTALRPLTDNVMSIAGTFTKAGTFAVGAVHNTVIYNGTNQAIVTPDGYQSAYHNLIINGTGAVFPSSLNIVGDLTINKAVDFSNKTISMIGTDADAHYIGGSVSPSFYNLTLNKPVGSGPVMLQNSISVTNTLTLNGGLLDIANYDLTLGANAVAGTFSTTSMIDADGTGRVRRPYTGTGSYTFPIGETTSNITYSPITVNVTSGTFSNAYVSVNVTDATHPNNYSSDNYLTRYWSVTQSGITNAVAIVTGNYVTGDAVGGESNLVAAQLNGTFNAVTNPWVRFGTLGSTTLTATNAVLTPGQTSYLTGIKGATITAAIMGDGTFCANTPVTLTTTVSGGVGNYTYNWTGGLGSGTTATPPTTTAGTTVYTLTVRDANGATATATATITVTSQPVGGTLSGSQSICAGSTPSAITLTGYIGTIIRWERSTTTAFNNPAFIISSNPTLTGAEIGNLTSTRYLRAVLQNGPCDLAYSNPIEIKINTTTWNGTSWDAGVPTASDAVVFNGNYTATASLSACTVTVNNGAAVTIPSGFTVTVNGSVTVNAGGSLTFNDNAALVQLTNAANSGNIVMHKTSNPLYRQDYTLWSAPVTGQNLLNFSPNTTATRFYEYKSSTDQYSAVDPAATAFAPAKGYLVRMPNFIAANVTGTTNGGTTTPTAYANGTGNYYFDGVFTGTPNNGTITYPLATTGNRFTAIGNPYPSPISVTAFFAANNTVMDVSSGIYLWRKRNNTTHTSYATISMAGFVANPAEGGGSEQGTFFQGSNTSWLIAPAQGFIVKTLASATNPAITFNNAMRRATPGTTQSFFRSAITGASRYWLNLQGSSSVSQNMVAYMEEGTTGLDYGYDAQRLSDGNLVSLYSVAQSVPLAIQARPQFAVTDVVPLGYNAPEAGSYNITLDHVDGVFAEGQKIYIRDNNNGAVHNLAEGQYTFTTEAGTFDNRFEIVYVTDALGVKDPAAADNNLYIFTKDKTIGITSTGNPITAVTIFDVRGRLLYSQKYQDEAVQISNFAAEQQVLIVKVETLKGSASRQIIF